MSSFFSMPTPCSPSTRLNLNAERHDFDAGRNHSLELLAIALVEQDERMKVAVAA